MKLMREARGWLQSRLIDRVLDNLNGNNAFLSKIALNNILFHDDVRINFFENLNLVYVNVRGTSSYSILYSLLLANKDIEGELPRLKIKSLCNKKTVTPKVVDAKWLLVLADPRKILVRNFYNFIENKPLYATDFDESLTFKDFVETIKSHSETASLLEDGIYTNVYDHVLWLDNLEQEWKATFDFDLFLYNKKLSYIDNFVVDEAYNMPVREVKRLLGEGKKIDFSCFYPVASSDDILDKSYSVYQYFKHR